MKISEIVRQHKEDILQRWMARVKEEMPEAQEHDRIALRNDLPDLLDDIAANVDQDQAHQDTHRSFEHGQLRSSFENYSMAHVVREYRVLMQVVLAAIDRQGSVSVSDRDKIIFAVTMAIEEAAQIFFHNRQQNSQLAQRAAQQLSDNLQQESELRDDFISTVTHDLRSPLANIQSLTELLKSRLDDDPMSAKLLSAVNTSAVRADELIQNLLDVNFIRAGRKLPVSRQPGDMLEIARASVDAFQVNERVDIQLISEADSVVGRWDSNLLRRALDNLISNAIKYGEGEVTVRCQTVPDSTLLLSVHNWGNPIPDDQQDKIFSRYYRRKDQDQLGWGIGLSLVQGIADAHEGTVTLSSSAQEGTLFTMRLPVEETNDEVT